VLAEGPKRARSFSYLWEHFALQAIKQNLRSLRTGRDPIEEDVLELDGLWPGIIGRAI
jgi:hypothetical protein